jgi:LPS export ABC transporter protein LptC
MKFFSYPSATLFLALALLSSCEVQQKKPPVEYKGPLSETENADVTYSEKDIVKTRMKAKKSLDFQNGDKEFPEGLYIEFYDELGVLSSTLKANNAYYFKEEDKWRGRGKVEVKNIEKQQQLNSEELFWKPSTKKIFTDKFVTIRDKNDVIYGTGLDADQNLTNYTILKPEGEFDITEEKAN